MAPHRGHRGNFRARGASRGRGNDRLARSGIRTKSGYRKFDSQRLKDVHDVESEDGDPEEPVAREVLSESDSDDNEDAQTYEKSYSVLLQSLQTNGEGHGRSAKRRKLGSTVDVAANGNGLDRTAEEDGGNPDQDSAEGAIEFEEVEALEAEDDKDLDESADGHDFDDIEQGDGSDDDRDSYNNGGAGEEEESMEPYDRHFASHNDEDLSKSIQAVKDDKWRTEKQSRDRQTVTESVPVCLNPIETRRPRLGRLKDIPIKHRLAQSAGQQLDHLDSVQQTVAPYLTTYTDLLFCNRTPQNADSLRQITCLHAINHVLKGRDKVLKNNARLSKTTENVDELDVRDQGFTRPKVLILVETRQMCAKYGTEIVNLFQPEQQENKKRFYDAFENEIDDARNMPEDFQDLFAGNNDNNFLTAIKFTRKTLKFYSAFYASDIIFASPLGLRRILENDDAKKRDHDFLSSIEMIVVDQTDAMQMQNWQNVEVVFSHLNLQLQEAHGCDFGRVRSWYLDGNAKHLRQTVVFSAYLTPEMNRLFSSSMVNIAGKVKITPTYEGAITTVSLGLKQTFSRFDSLSPAAGPDDRFRYFTSAILPSLLRLPRPTDGGLGILIFIPSYYDFLRMRNYFATSIATQNISFGAIHDYSALTDQRRARSHFLTGRYSFLLYTQRAHHFFRLKLRGVKRVMMYGLPDNSLFYNELLQGYLGMSINEGKCSVEESGARCMFSKWDGLKMERICGSSRIKGMLSGAGDTFDFV